MTVTLFPTVVHPPVKVSYHRTENHYVDQQDGCMCMARVLMMIYTVLAIITAKIITIITTTLLLAF